MKAAAYLPRRPAFHRARRHRLMPPILLLLLLRTLAVACCCMWLKRSVEEWLNLHGVDILCLQEVKTTEKKITEQLLDHHGGPLTAYDSFWSCCSHGDFKGFNGVATFARKGTPHHLHACEHSGKHL